MSMKPDEGRGRCPYDPYQRNTAIIVGKQFLQLSSLCTCRQQGALKDWRSCEHKYGFSSNYSGRDDDQG